MTETAKSKNPKVRRGKTRDQANAIYQSVEELAKELGISRQSAYAALRNNTIPHIRLGKRYVLPRAAIAEWFRNPAAFEALQEPKILPRVNLGSARH